MTTHTKYTNNMIHL